MLGFGDICVATQPPIANAEPNTQTVYVGEEAWFYGNSSYDPDGYIVSYDWDFGDGNSDSGENTSHVYSIPGNYTVSLTVTDNTSLIDTDTVNITILESPPGITVWIESLTTDREVYDVNETINATVKIMRGFDVLPIIWEGTLVFEVFNSTMVLVYTEDQQVILSSGGMTKYYYFEFDLNETGEYLVRATLYKGGITLVDMKEISITIIEEWQNQPPIAIIEPNYQEVDVGKELWFDGNLSYDPDGHIIAYNWDFGDGITGGGVNISHIFTAPGNYTVTLTVTDNSSVDDIDTIIVTVEEPSQENLLPIANGEPDTQTVYVGEQAWFDGNLSYDPDGFIVSYYWDLGDGNSSSGTNISYVYNNPGNYNVTLTVTDNNDASDQDTIIVIAEELGGEPADGNETPPFVDESNQWNIPVIAIAAVGTLVVVATICLTEVGKYILLSFILLLYTKLKREEILDHFTRGKIYGYILANPGDHYNSIKRALNISNGLFAYHLRVLEKEGFIKSTRDGTYKRFYPSEMRVSSEGTLKNSRTLIIEKIKETPGISQKDIASLLGLSSATISYHIKELLKLGIIKAERKGMRLKYYLNSEKEEVEKELTPKSGSEKVREKKLIDAREAITRID